ncbi:MAG: glycoside hydrolase family 13 protein, partial [Gammaproteobacteria bacterium]|nr:glycoside hydrolase family 13 protein [Gammaproteobacteria bacterium]
MKIALIIALSLIFLSACQPQDGKPTHSDSQQSDKSDSKDEFVPQWAKKVVWYQIFPERFRDGDPTNNPTLESIIGADPQVPPKHWRVHPWGSDWYQLQDYEKANGEPELWKHLLRRRYGGDLQGVIDKLDYLQSLGITAIYFNPVFYSPSLHKYDGASYHHIDPHFGPDPEGDKALIAKENPLDPDSWVWTSADELALKMIQEAHKRNIRVIFDGVFNHMGINSFAFQDVVKNQQKSPYKDWFIIDSFDDPEKGTQFSHTGWFGNKSLPEFREDSNGIVSGPKAYIFNATKRWMNPKNKGVEYGIDGWRLDVAYNVHHNFWKDWRKLVKSINPEAYLTAEIVDKPEKVQPYLMGDEFDGEMNYNFAFTATEFLFNPVAIKPSEFDAKLATLRNLYPSGVAYVNQNLFGSHDSNRIGSHIVNSGIGNFRNWGKYFGLSQAANNPDYQVRKPNEQETRLQKLFVILQMTYVGAPMIYYGDEVGMWGANDPDTRKPMLWPDIHYVDEIYLPNGQKRPESMIDKVEINSGL